jgi:hypothetical protein
VVLVAVLVTGSVVVLVAVLVTGSVVVLVAVLVTGSVVVLVTVLVTGSVTPPNCAWPVPGQATRLANAPATPMIFQKSNVFMMHALP